MKIKLWPPDADSFMEKFTYVMMYLGAPLAFFYMQLSAWGVFKNCYQQSVSHYGFGWHLFGFFFSAAAVYLVIAMKNDANWLLRLGLKWNIAGQIAVGILAVVGILGYSGFSWWFNVCQ